MRKITTAAAALLVGFTFATPASPAPGPWVLSFPARTSWNRVVTFWDGTAYVVLNPVSGTHVLLKSTDFGLTWTRRTVPGTEDAPPGIAYDLAMATKTRGFLREATWQEPHPIHRTDDGGATWRVVGHTPPLPRGYYAYPHPLTDAAPGGNTVAYYDSPYRRTLACPLDFEWPQASMMVSRDAGVTWSRSPLGFHTGWLHDMDWWDDNIGAIAVDEAVVSPGACWNDTNLQDHRPTVWTTRDAGRTWRRSAIRCAERCGSVSWASPRRLVATGRHGEVYASDDAGRTARRIGTIGSVLPEVDNYYPIHPWDLDFADDALTGYAITNHSQTYRTTDGGRTWTLDDMHEVNPNSAWRSVATFDGLRTIAVTPLGVRVRLSQLP